MTWKRPNPRDADRLHIDTELRGWLWAIVVADLAEALRKDKEKGGDDTK